ncbi:MAG: adenosylcobinamide amidohydrolase [Roseobacter sp.]
MTGLLHLDRPWLALDFDQPQRVLSWAINRPGFVETRRILWREVRNADLPPDLDVAAWLADALRRRESSKAVAFLTSRDIRAYQDATVTIDGVTSRCIATVGLSNAERIGTLMDRTGQNWGTINIAVATACGLTDAARIEALSIASQARTVAVLDAGFDLPTGRATGTGTDCIAIAAPEGNITYAGLHTALGAAVGRCVLQAVSAGVQEWMTTVKRAEATE